METLEFLISLIPFSYHGNISDLYKDNMFPWKPLPRKLIDAYLHLTQKLLHAFEMSIAIVTYFRSDHCYGHVLHSNVDWTNTWWFLLLFAAHFRLDCALKGHRSSSSEQSFHILSCIKYNHKHTANNKGRRGYSCILCWPTHALNNS